MNEARDRAKAAGNSALAESSQASRDRAAGGEGAEGRVPAQRSLTALSAQLSGLLLADAGRERPGAGSDDTSRRGSVNAVPGVDRAGQEDGAGDRALELDRQPRHRRRREAKRQAAVCRGGAGAVRGRTVSGASNVLWAWMSRPRSSWPQRSQGAPPRTCDFGLARRGHMRVDHGERQRPILERGGAAQTPERSFSVDAIVDDPRSRADRSHGLARRRARRTSRTRGTSASATKAIPWTRNSDCRQFTSCATFAIATLSACRWKMSSVSPASNASRMRRLLAEQMRRVHRRAGTVPCAPLVDDELHAVTTIDLLHDLPVIGDQRLHAIGFVEELVPFVGREVDGVTLAGVPVGCRAAADVPRIVM